MSPKKKKRSPKRKAPTTTSRDYLLVQIINGATKAGTHKDKKKDKNKKDCRKKVKGDE